MAVARVTEITASSPKSIEGAVEDGLRRASKTLRGITGLELVAIKVKVEKGKVVEYRVNMKITFVLDE